MSDDIREGDPERSRKKKKPPQDDEDDRPRKKRRRRDDDDADVARDDDDVGNSPLGAMVPLGVSIWALLSLYSSLLSCFIPGLGLLAVLFGVLAFFTHKHKASYGSISGNMRAIMGILIGLLTTLGWMVFAVAYFLSKK